MHQPIFKNIIRNGKKEPVAVIPGNKSFSKRGGTEEWICKHRDQNGWCSRSQRQCTALNPIFINH